MLASLKNITVWQVAKMVLYTWKWMIIIVIGTIIFTTIIESFSGA